ncbi:MAG: cytochrome b/b6 domain-containing protein [Bacteroidota bacterium]|nr:cytochrome b/b6 domain-containing protein [Bacteroidota bacterium]
MSLESKIYFYPVWLRIWHGINALGIIILIFTGISLQYSNPDFYLINFQLAINLHNIAGILVTLNYLLFFIGNIMTSNKKYYRLKLKGLIKRLKLQIIYYTSGMFNNQQAPFPLSEKRKFNPMQKVAYLSVMYLFVPGLIFTGLALLFPETIIEEVYSFSGIFLTAVLHASLGFLVSIFMVVHLYVASIGKHPAKNFKSIIDGYHDISGH